MFRVKRWVLAVLAASAGFVGGWASLMPRSFYDSFPLPGHAWVRVLGPYNEHLTRDVGTLYLAFLVVSVWGVLHPTTQGFALAGVAWLVFSVPHLAFHLTHLKMYGSADRAGNVISLGGTVLLAGLLLLPHASTRRHPDPDAGGVRRRPCDRTWS